jgi:putative redox protein
MDKSQELEVSLNLKNNRLNFWGIADDNSPVSIDYIPPFGDGLGYTSLELLLMSLASCYGSALALLLRKTGKSVTSMQIRSHGDTKTEHPTGFRTILIHFDLNTNATADEITKVLRMAEERYCPVYDMLKGNVEVITGFSLIAAETA